MTRTSLMYAEPSVWEGISRLLDWRGGMPDYNLFSTEEEADVSAIASDWETVGTDLADAISKGSEQLNRRVSE